MTEANSVVVSNAQAESNGHTAIPWGLPQTRAELIEIKLLFAVAVFLAVIYSLDLLVPARSVSVIGCLAIIAALSYGAVRQLRTDPVNIWGALFWFRLACIGYHGFGALLPYTGAEETVINLKQLYPFSDEEALKSTLINVVAIIFVLLGALIINPLPALASTAFRPTIPIEVVCLVFLIAGGLIHYLIVVPFLFGFGDGVLHSIVPSIAKMYHAGLMLLIILAGRRGAFVKVLALVLILVEICVGVLLFSKGQVIATCIFAMIAIYQVRPSFSRLAAGLLGVVILFAQIEPIITVGRGEVIRIGGTRQTATLSERLEILENYFDGRYDTSENAIAHQAAISRLSYVNAATMVISMYDQGRPGNTLEHIFVAFIPRFLWPEKPLMTLSGQDLYTAATGQVGTSISAGLFAEAYWNLGWLGLPILMVPMGMILQMLTKVSIGYVTQDRWIFLPAMLIAIQIGTRIDGGFVIDMVGPPALVLVAVWLLRKIESQFARKVELA